MTRSRLRSAVLVLALFTVAPPAHAFSLSASGGLPISASSHNNAWKSPGYTLGAELSLDFSSLELGGIYQFLKFGSKTGGADSQITFYGGVARLNIPETGLFIDVKAGASHPVRPATFKGGFSYGLGLGYSIRLGPVFSLRPRVGYLMLNERPAEGAPDFTRPYYEAGALLTISLI